MYQIRELNEGDREAWAQIAAQAYRRGDMGEAQPRWPGGDYTRFGLFEDGQQVAQFHLWHYEMFFGGQKVRMGGVASVACLPLARGKGYVEVLLRHGLEEMRERGESISVLHAFLIGLYRPMGWEWVGSQRAYTLPLACLPPGLETAKVRAAVPEDAPTLCALYESEASRYRGTLVRPLSWWHERLEATTGFTHYFFLYEDPQPRGYIYLQLRDPPRVRELMWQTPEAYAALLGVLRRHKSQFEQFLWDAPPDDPLWHYAAHRQLKVSWAAPFSARIVDLPATVSLLRPPDSLSGSCVVRIDDPLAAATAGTWQIEVEGGAARAARSSRTPQVAGDIGAWSQALFGDPAADELRRAGRLSVRDEAGFSLLRSLCPPALSWTNDGF